MISRSALAAAAVMAAMNLTGTAFAGADDYVFETVKPEIKSIRVWTMTASATGLPVAL